jgi:UDP-N-acetylglucosamine 3-dehydrogenase
MKGRLRVSILGLGVMGRRHARVFAEIPARFELVGAFDPRLDAFEAAPAVTRFGSEEEAIGEADLVVVATPIDQHAPSVRRALAAGRHVLVEKPIAARVSEAAALLDGRFTSRSAPSARRGALFVGHSERFNPVVRALTRLLRSDRALTLDFRRVGPSRGPAGDVGVLVNLGVHDFDLASYLTGSPVEVVHAVGSASVEGQGDGTGPGSDHARAGARDVPSALPERGRGLDGTSPALPERGRRLEDVAHVVFVTASGAIGHIHVDRTSPRKQRTIELKTPAWTYEGDLVAHKLVRTFRATGKRSDVPLVLEEPLVAQAHALAAALETRRPAKGAREIASGEDGLRALVLAACAVQTLHRADPRRAKEANDSPSAKAT